MRARGILAALLLPLALLTACGGDSGSSTATDPGGADSTSASASESASDTASASPSDAPSTSPTPQPKKPQCDEVWQEGNKLPGGYDGCYDGDRRVKPDGRYCEIGKPLFTYQDNWYAAPGGPVNHTEGPLEKDPGYLTAVRACGG